MLQGNLPRDAGIGFFAALHWVLTWGIVFTCPRSYGKKGNAKRRYPAVYHLHGGRPGNEAKSVKLARFINAGIHEAKIKPTVYVFANGGPVSWYNMPGDKKAQGEDVFVKELIPHIDRTYRTVAKRGGRAIEGFSQGGRGTTRIMFKYPELFGSTAPGGSGYEPEERIRDNDGAESDKIRFAPGYDAWTLAKDYSERKNAPPLQPLIWVGSRGFNYEYNLKFMKYLEKLKIPHEKLIVPDAPHSTRIIYEKNGLEIMKFHDRNFGK